MGEIRVDDNKKLLQLFGSMLLFVFSLFLLFLAKEYKGFAEWYSATIYPVLVNCFGRLESIFPFSLVEIFLYVALTVCVISIFIFILKVFRKQKKFSHIYIGFLYLVHGAAILFFLYTINCGINYQRVSFSQHNGFEVVSYTSSDLAVLCEDLTVEVNLWAGMVKRNTEGICIVDINVQNQAVEAMKEISKDYIGLSDYYPRPKKLWASGILSVQSLSGIYSPFTIEANYNGDMLPYNIPFTACHELSHLKGFMQEDEANFIAYLACEKSDIPEFRYSGSLTAWISSMNVLSKSDKEAYKRIRRQLNPIVEADLTANNSFWKRYDTKVAKAAVKMNDTYLKANGQSDGVKSYNRMVDLMVGYKVFFE
ncbi:DUF3810 domain-containing protein [uncultured Robinsoniella sp.]|uniref:DUF3810 domain-containing protein n=1 Tax=uncultured Robinsoniella sp. TaxID=904190 RepID=UPI00374E4D98